MAELEAGTTTGAARARPLSPHLQIYKPMLTMMMSIVHRVTGATLYFGMLLLAWWLIAAATGPNAYANVEWFMGSSCCSAIPGRCSTTCLAASVI